MSFTFSIACKNKELEIYYNNFMSKRHKGDSGIDLFFPEDILIPAESTMLVSLGIFCQCEEHGDGNNKSSYMMFPRSSIYKTPLLLCNSIGLIDRDYIGEIKAPFYNRSKEDYLIKAGTSLLQLVAPNLKESGLKIVKEINIKNNNGGTRQTGGFGSTNTNTN